MNLLFIRSLMEHDWHRLHNLSLILAVFYACVLCAILVDLASGVEKAHRNKVLRTSFGFRRTISKVKDYFSVLMLFTIADVVASVWFTLPFFTAIGTIAMILIEARSVYENKKDINKGIKDLPDALLQILRNKDKAEELLNFLEQNKNIDRHNTNQDEADQ